MTVQPMTALDELAEMDAAEAAHQAAPLTAADLEVLEFARLRWKHLGAKEQAVTERFLDSLEVFEMRLTRVLAKPAALTYDAQLVHRLRALRNTRASARLEQGHRR